MAKLSAVDEMGSAVIRYHEALRAATYAALTLRRKGIVPPSVSVFVCSSDYVVSLNVDSFDKNYPWSQTNTGFNSADIDEADMKQYPPLKEGNTINDEGARK